MPSNHSPVNLEPFDSQAFLAQTTQRPGVYQMLSAEGDVLYVGKAKNLKQRLASYFRSSGLAIKTQALVQRIQGIQLTITGSETEALLLEQNLIKKLRPPYNILLRDDKSYPFIFISDTHQYPAIQFHRGSRRHKGRYFGPFPSSGAVRDSLNLLQKIFRIRQCEESFFKNRSRPCLQYQINRCSGPCVNKITPENYADDIRHAMMFLEGKNQSIRDELAKQMERAAESLDFELAAELRDQIISLQKVQEEQHISGVEGDADILACAISAGAACIHQLFVKGGRVIGSKAHYPKLALETTESELLSSFIGQYYLQGAEIQLNAENGTEQQHSPVISSSQGSARPVPPQLILSHEADDVDCLVAALTAVRGKRIQVTSRVRGARSNWLKLAMTNAEQQIQNFIANRQNIYRRYIELQEALGLDEAPKRMECFDISHSSGEATVASCVVFDNQGPKKSDYRRFNIETAVAGDDYGAMNEALTRRYKRLKKDDAILPDILIVDGGKGQLKQAKEVLAELQIDTILVLGIAKGVTRKPGLESIIHADTYDELVLPTNSGALHLLQHIRDEAHRFAITGHRQRRAKKRGQSALEQIPGVGPKRRKELLKHFGGVQEIGRASVEEIAKVSTISRVMAEEIYAHLHRD
ncbi:excinuclease ABC subunit UvrC [Motiliproteus sp. MSK22-1]|uniref:excinuclease ABC subunit UvrC n=1 Tax=Motiliproteus sp. MSK22-1 TaxID=1897630 RepID=UPI000976C18F|nr:excinuclease ABC subunit UvrC [Motiliproteus sp. MSK22-1]OMH32692.1 excinuclease ABC subunit C [Motiliproteus sp. MSK22-1]